MIVVVYNPAAFFENSLNFFAKFCSLKNKQTDIGENITPFAAVITNCSIYYCASYASTVLAVIVCLSVCLSVTSLSCTKMAISDHTNNAM